MTEEKHQYLYRIMDENETAIKHNDITDYNWVLTSHITESEMIKTAKSLVKVYRKLNRYVEYKKLYITDKNLTVIKYNKKEENETGIIIGN